MTKTTCVLYGYPEIALTVDIISGYEYLIVDGSKLAGVDAHS